MTFKKAVFGGGRGEGVRGRGEARPHWENLFFPSGEAVELREPDGGRQSMRRGECAKLQAWHASRVQAAQAKRGSAGDGEHRID